MSRKRKGSSLVLIIFIVLTLVMFGVTQLLISWNSYKISKKTASWTESYYNTEAKAQRFLSQLDSLTKSKGVSMAAVRDFVVNYSQEHNTISSSCDGKGITMESSLKSPCVLDVYFFNDDNIRDFLVRISVDLNARSKTRVLTWKKLPTHFEYKNEEEFDVIGNDEPAFGEGGFDDENPFANDGGDDVITDGAPDNNMNNDAINDANDNVNKDNNDANDDVNNTNTDNSNDANDNGNSDNGDDDIVILPS